MQTDGLNDFNKSSAEFQMFLKRLALLLFFGGGGGGPAQPLIKTSNVLQHLLWMMSKFRSKFHKDTKELYDDGDGTCSWVQWT
jgi:hypothetical protein